VQVKANLDYKNVSFLMEFVTASGRLKGRKHTQLNPLLHSRAARAVKLARSMALMPYEMQSGDEPADGGASSMRLRQFAAAQAAQQQQQRQGSDKRGRRGPREQAERAAPAGA
jgi:ribosomal protein S18